MNKNLHEDERIRRQSSQSAGMRISRNLSPIRVKAKIAMLTSGREGGRMTISESNARKDRQGEMPGRAVLKRGDGLNTSGQSPDTSTNPRPSLKTTSLEKTNFFPTQNSAKDSRKNFEKKRTVSFNDNPIILKKPKSSQNSNSTSQKFFPWEKDPSKHHPKDLESQIKGNLSQITSSDSSEGNMTALEEIKLARDLIKKNKKRLSVTKRKFAFRSMTTTVELFRGEKKTRQYAERQKASADMRSVRNRMKINDTIAAGMAITNSVLAYLSVNCPF